MSVQDDDVERLRDFYKERVRTHGLTHQGMGFNRRESQLRRFEVLASVGDLHGKRVLDVGAGLGDFLVYLWDRGIVPDYTGLDVCEHFVEACRERFREPGPGPATFVAGDILDFVASEPFDYVVSSGIFGYLTASAVARVAPTLSFLFSLCRRGAAVNFLSARAEQRAPDRLYLPARDLLDVAFELTPAVVLRHDYLPNDFTLLLYRERSWDTARARREGEHAQIC